MGLTEQFKRHVQQENLFHPGDKLLLAVSGGVDSVVLAELCRQAGYAFSIAHCNFRLREKESDRDAQFVKSLAKEYGVEFFCKEFDTHDYAAKNKLSIQEAARELRYTWFNELITHHASPAGSSGHITHILTAHHANDNIETVVMNFFRGTGLGGLKGIDAKSGKLIRPLLIFSKQQLIDFAGENNLEFVEDSSNKSSKYTRNLFRNEIIPAIEKAYAGVTQNLFDNIERFREIHKLYQYATDKLINKLVKVSGDERRVPVKQLMEFNNRALIYQLISPYGFTEKQVTEVEKLAAAESGKFIQSPDKSYQLIRHRHWFIIAPVNSTEVDHYVIKEKGLTQCGDKKIAITRSDYTSQLIPAFRAIVQKNKAQAY